MSVLGARAAGRIAVLATAVLVVTPAFAAAAGTAPARHVLRPHALPAPVFRPAQHWAVNRAMCPPAKPGWRGCFAVARRQVPAGTPGAYPYTPAALHGPAGGLTPAALAHAYGVRPDTATTQTVAVVDAYDDPHAFAELVAFDAKYGLPRETTQSFTRVAQDGSRNFPVLNRGWAVEEALDVQAVRGMCHKCKIILVEARSASTWNLSRAAETAYRLGATVISNSYGGPESPYEDPRVQQAYSHKGIVVTASTGDHGWYGWDEINDGWPSTGAPDEPAAFPSVVAVGGTKLTLNSDGSVASERVWNRNGQADGTGLRSGPQGASGGGCSQIYQAAPWQSSVADYPNMGCGGYRMVGDISADADPTTGMDIYSFYFGGSAQWETVGGTSLAAPLIAGMWAVAGGPAGAEAPAKTLYDNLQLRPVSLFDVRIGSNGFCGASDVVISKLQCSQSLEKVSGTGDPNLLSFSDGTPVGNVDCGWRQDGVRGTVSADWQCRAHAGYDGPSGVGAPRSNQLFRTTVTAQLSPVGTATVGVPVTVYGVGTITVPSSADTVESCAFYWGDGTPGTQVPCATGQTISAQHTYGSPGTYAAKLVVNDTQGERVTATQPVAVS